MIMKVLVFYLLMETLIPGMRWALQLKRLINIQIQFLFKVNISFLLFINILVKVYDIYSIILIKELHIVPICIPQEKMTI